MEIKDKRGSENLVAYHLSHLESDKEIEDRTKIKELLVTEAHFLWYADFVNYLACNLLPPRLS